MGENAAALSKQELQKVLKEYGLEGTFMLIRTLQIDPDTSLYELDLDAQKFYVLEADYISDLEDAMSRFEEGLQFKPQLVQVIDPPEAFDYEPYLKARPDYFTKDGDDYNRLRLYLSSYQPKRWRYGYPLVYLVATKVEAGKH